MCEVISSPFPIGPKARESSQQGYEGLDALKWKTQKALYIAGAMKGPEGLNTLEKQLVGAVMELSSSWVPSYPL
jgi:hypothetical protein